MDGEVMRFNVRLWNGQGLMSPQWLFSSVWIAFPPEFRSFGWALQAVSLHVWMDAHDDMRAVVALDYLLERGWELDESRTDARFLALSRGLAVVG